MFIGVVREKIIKWVCVVCLERFCLSRIEVRLNVVGVLWIIRVMKMMKVRCWVEFVDEVFRVMLLVVVWIIRLIVVDDGCEWFLLWDDCFCGGGVELIEGVWVRLNWFRLIWKFCGCEELLSCWGRVLMRYIRMNLKMIEILIYVCGLKLWLWVGVLLGCLWEMFLLWWLFDDLWLLFFLFLVELVCGMMLCLIIELIVIVFVIGILCWGNIMLFGICLKDF